MSLSFGSSLLCPWTLDPDRLALKLAKRWINADVFHQVVYTYSLEASMVARTILTKAGQGPRLQDAPSSVEDFLTVTAYLFSPELQDHHRAIFKHFDHLCGQALSDTFLAQKSIVQWAQEIFDRLLCYFKNLALKKFFNHKREVDVYLANTLEPRSPVPDPPPLVPIYQIRLQGENLKDAWSANEDVQQICDFKKIPGLHSWTPSVPGGAPVFRGVRDHLDEDGLQKVEREIGSMPAKFTRKVMESQLFPLGAEYQGLYTSFSALRAFLWAVFQAEVIVSLPVGERAAILTHEFKLRGETFHGVLLFKFHSNQPAPAGLTHFQVPEGKEGAWRDIAHKWNHQQPGFWQNAVAHIHHQETRGFPDIIHGKDITTLQAQLASWPCQKSLLWQTAVMSEAALAHLNQHLAGVYAISFDQLHPDPPPPPSKQGRKLTTLTRAAGKAFKKMVQRGPE